MLTEGSSVFADVNSKSARVLVVLVVPGHLFFLYIIHLLQGGHTAMTPTFIVCYLSAAVLQVAKQHTRINGFLSLWGLSPNQPTSLNSIIT